MGRVQILNQITYFTVISTPNFLLTSLLYSILKVVAIHSDIPDEEQAEAFVVDNDGDAGDGSSKKKRQQGVVKVVVATNAAESSITLPDCDHVVCLGVHKQIEYNSATHRTMLAGMCFMNGHKE
jgi:HrpA-like RNA helicase